MQGACTYCGSRCVRRHLACRFAPSQAPFPIGPLPLSPPCRRRALSYTSCSQLLQDELFGGLLVEGA